jgi:hypothetical protein
MPTTAKSATAKVNRSSCQRLHAIGRIGARLQCIACSMCPKEAGCFGAIELSSAIASALWRA